MSTSVKALFEITADGYLRMDLEVAQEFFPEDALVALVRNRSLYLLPTRGPAAGGLILKQRNLRGDRAVLILEVLQFGESGRIPSGFCEGAWDDAIGGLRLSLAQEAVP